ncbi:MAG TPA: GNAT family N-acetyltransferase [Acidimicrobiia bacterium]|nr:GNAT family N-acetyltransferase [Acidimicrobiia bacterium]
MAQVIECDPRNFLERAGAWLEREPVLHNVLCTVVHRAIRNPAPFGDARWFVLEEDGEPVGSAMLTPPFPLTLTPMPTRHLHDLADTLAACLPQLRGVSGPDDVAGRFAELWAARTGVAVEHGMDQLMYALDTVVPAPSADGKLRPAEAADRQLLCDWVDAFVREVGGVSGDIAGMVDYRLATGGLYLWEHTDVVTLAGVTPAVAGVVRVGPVYTPPEARRRGYATSCVAAVSQQALDAGASACMLFTDKANPTSNSIYQRIGYRLVATASEYRFR